MTKENRRGLSFLNRHPVLHRRQQQFRACHRGGCGGLWHQLRRGVCGGYWTADRGAGDDRAGQCGIRFQEEIFHPKGAVPRSGVKNTFSSLIKKWIPANWRGSIFTFLVLTASFLLGRILCACLGSRSAFEELEQSHCQRGTHDRPGEIDHIEKRVRRIEHIRVDRFGEQRRTQRTRRVERCSGHGTAGEDGKGQCEADRQPGKRTRPARHRRGHHRASVAIRTEVRPDRPRRRRHRGGGAVPRCRRRDPPHLGGPRAHRSPGPGHEDPLRGRCERGQVDLRRGG